LGRFDNEEEAARERDLELLRMVQEADVSENRAHFSACNHKAWPDSFRISPALLLPPTQQGERPPPSRFNFSPDELLKHGLPPRRSFKQKTSQYMGVSWIESRGKWQAAICLPKSAGGQELNRNLSIHATEEQAARARDRAILKLVEQVGRA
jgi:hypothetical protein